MAPERKWELTAGELAALVREVAVDEGGYVSFWRFRQLTGLPHSELYRHYAGWDEALSAAGIEKPQRRGSVFARDELLGEWHRLVSESWRTPTVAEWSQRARMSWGPMWSVFNGQENLLAAYREYLSRLVPESETQASAGECGWVREQWEGLRMGFAWRSSEFPVDAWTRVDVLVVWELDAELPGLPLLELGKMCPWLGEWLGEGRDRSD